MGYRTAGPDDNQRVVTLFDPAGNPISSTNRLPVDAAVTVVIPGVAVPGAKMRYERMTGPVDLNGSGGAFKDIYEITEASVFYKLLFDVNSDNIHVRVEIDGTQIWPSPNGFRLEDLEDLCLSGAIGVGGEEYVVNSGANDFGLFQYSSNKWMWIPPEPLDITSSLKLQMRSSDTSSTRDFIDGIAIRRTLV